MPFVLRSIMTQGRGTPELDADRAAIWGAATKPPRGLDRVKAMESLLASQNLTGSKANRERAMGVLERDLKLGPPSMYDVGSSDVPDEQATPNQRATRQALRFVHNSLWFSAYGASPAGAARRADKIDRQSLPGLSSDNIHLFGIEHGLSGETIADTAHLVRSEGSIHWLPNVFSIWNWMNGQGQLKTGQLGPASRLARANGGPNTSALMWFMAKVPVSPKGFLTRMTPEQGTSGVSAMVARSLEEGNPHELADWMDQRAAQLDGTAKTSSAEIAAYKGSYWFTVGAATGEMRLHPERELLAETLELMRRRAEIVDIVGEMRDDVRKMKDMANWYRAVAQRVRAMAGSMERGDLGEEPVAAPAAEAPAGPAEDFMLPEADAAALAEPLGDEQNVVLQNFYADHRGPEWYKRMQTLTTGLRMTAATLPASDPAKAEYLGQLRRVLLARERYLDIKAKNRSLLAEAERSGAATVDLILPGAVSWDETERIRVAPEKVQPRQEQPAVRPPLEQAEPDVMIRQMENQVGAGLRTGIGTAATAPPVPVPEEDVALPPAGGPRVPQAAAQAMERATELGTSVTSAAAAAHAKRLAGFFSGQVIASAGNGNFDDAYRLLRDKVREQAAKAGASRAVSEDEMVRMRDFVFAQLGLDPETMALARRDILIDGRVDPTRMKRMPSASAIAKSLATLMQSGSYDPVIRAEDGVDAFGLYEVLGQYINPIYRKDLPPVIVAGEKGAAVGTPAPGASATAPGKVFEDVPSGVRPEVNWASAIWYGDHFEVQLRPNQCYACKVRHIIDTDSANFWLPVSVQEGGETVHYLWPVDGRIQGIDSPDEYLSGSSLWKSTPKAERLRIRNEGTVAVRDLVNQADDVAVYVFNLQTSNRGSAVLPVGKRLLPGDEGRWILAPVLDIGGQVVDVRKWLVEHGYAKYYKGGDFGFRDVDSKNQLVLRALGGLGKRDDLLGAHGDATVLHKRIGELPENLRKPIRIE